MCTLICFMIPRAMLACTKYVTASYHINSLHLALRLRLTFAAQIGTEPIRRAARYHIYSGNEPVTASYHACSGAESGKTGEASKSAAVFTPVDNDILDGPFFCNYTIASQFVVVKKRNVKNKKEQKRSSVIFRHVWQRSKKVAVITQSCRLRFRSSTLRLRISVMLSCSRKAPGL